MTTKEFAKIGRQLVPYYPGFAVEGHLFLKPPVGDFLSGLCFERTSGAKDFYVRLLFLPLFIPQDHIAFWCGRIRRNGRELWFADDPNLVANLHETIQSEAIPFLNSVSTLNGALDYLRREIELTRPRVDSHTLEGFAYTLIKAGDYPAALDALSELEHIYEEIYRNEKTPACVLEQRARARLVQEKLSRNPDEAIAQLESWKAQTKSNFKLEKYP